jgi:AraC-like DNA-binding protein
MERKAFPYRQRATLVAHLPLLLEEFGVPLDKALSGTGIAASDLVPDAFLPYAAVLALLDRAAALSGREDFGVVLGQRLSLAALGPAGEVLQQAGTLGEALSDYVQFQIWNSTGAAAYLYRTPQDFTFGYGIYDPAGAGAVQVHDLAITAGCLLIFLLTEYRVRPTEIWSIRPAPAEPGALARFAGCPVRYGQEQTCIFLPPAAAQFALAKGDRAAHAAALARLAARTAAAPWGKAASVRHALRAAIVAGRLGMPEIAAGLGQHPRSLRRALEREGTTFTALRDEVRVTMGRELLSLTPLHVGDIAQALGFADISAFTHAFTLRSGIAPTKWRRLHSAGTRVQGQSG